MSNNTSDKLFRATFIIRNSLLNLFLLFLAVLQGSSQLLVFLSKENEIKLPLLNVWISLGNEISENWVAVSISLIFLVLGYLLYSSLSHTSPFPGSNSKTVVFLFINLALCLRVYSSSSVSEKISYLATQLPAVIVVSIIVFFLTAGILVIQKEHKNTKELDRLFQEANNKSEGTTSTESEDVDNGEPNTDTRSDTETAFRLKHPFSYAFRSFAKDLDKKYEIKREHKKQLLEIKVEAEKQKKKAELDNLQKIGYNYKGENVAGYFSAFLSFFICVGGIIIVFAQNSNEDTLNIIQGIADYILGITGILDSAKGPLTNFLLSSGILFLFVILIMTFFLLVYTSIRVIVYLLSRPDEDTARIHRLGKAIKTFVLGILDGALRPLLFLPDFFECIEKLLLDTDMDEKINEMYPPMDLSSKANTSSAPGEDHSEYTGSNR